MISSWLILLLINNATNSPLIPELCVVILSLAYISRLMSKCRMICRLTPKSCLMYAGLRLAKTFVCCCIDQLNKRLADSKIESVRHLLCSVRANSTFVVASSQSQRIAFMTRSATMAFAINNYCRPKNVRWSLSICGRLGPYYTRWLARDTLTETWRWSPFSFVIHFSATPKLAARARCMFIISYNYDVRIAVH